jgi:hypothetical protein
VAPPSSILLTAGAYHAGALRVAIIKLLTPLLVSAQRTEMANLKRLIEGRPLPD